MGDAAPRWAPTAGWEHVAVHRGGRLTVRATDGARLARARVDADAAGPIRAPGAALRVVLGGVIHCSCGLLAGLCEEADSDRRECSNVVASARDVRRDRGDRNARYCRARPTRGNRVVRWANRRISLAGVGIRCVTGDADRAPAVECLADQTE